MVGLNFLTATAIVCLRIFTVVSSGSEHCLNATNNGGCAECIFGWYGSMCEPCPGHCDPGGCNHETGICRGCQSGYYTKECSVACPKNCPVSFDNKVFCARDSGRCLETCESPWWGDQCNNSCSDNCLNQNCRPSDGSCPDGCHRGYTGVTCGMKCPSGCLDDTCHQHTLKCTNGCKVGYYGDLCELRCNDGCLDNDCKLVAEVVTCTRGCVPGRCGSSCDSPCPENCGENTCHQTNGTCSKGCKSGYYGDSCDAICPHNCLNSSCMYSKHIDEVSCTQGCVAGKTTLTCGESCTSGCMSCSQTTGECLDITLVNNIPTTTVPKHGVDQKLPSAVTHIIVPILTGLAVLAIVIAVLVYKRHTATLVNDRGIQGTPNRSSTNSRTGLLPSTNNSDTSERNDPAIAETLLI